MAKHRTKSKVRYLDIEDYEDYIERLKNRKQTFVVSKTTYSRKVETESLTLIFNTDAKGDNKLLALINAVRKNARDYLGRTSYEKRSEYIHFFDLFNIPKSDEVICKIDVKSAYWAAALKRGVVEEVTNRRLLEDFADRPAKEMKNARLKALGSLATTKTISRYEKGKLQPIKPEDIVTEPTKEIYMDICRDVDILMRDCASENHTVVYYYWDCIFVPKHTAADVLDFFKKRDYNVTVEETKLSYINIFNKGGGYILSESDDKAYMVRKESIGLIQNL